MSRRVQVALMETATTRTQRLLMIEWLSSSVPRFLTLSKRSDGNNHQLRDRRKARILRRTRARDQG